MNRLTLLLTVLLAAGCFHPTYVPPARAQAAPADTPDVAVSGDEGTEVLAEGLAAVASSVDIARNQALNDALRKAVEQGVGTLVNSETRAQNLRPISDGIYSQVSGYVASFQVVSEGRDGDVYRVMVRVKVKLDRIEDDLAAIGIPVQEQGRPRTMVVVKLVGNPDEFEVAGDMMDREMVETRIVSYLQTKGFPVVDEATVRQNLDKDQLKKILAGDNQAAMLAGLKSGAEVVIAGTMDQRTVQKRVPYAQTEADFYTVRLSCRAVNAQSAEVLGASAVVREVPYSAGQAIEQAADSVSAELTSRILAGWKKRLNITQLYCSNASYERVEKLKSQALAGLRGVSAVITRDLTGTDAVLELVSDSTTRELFDLLGSRKFDIGFAVQSLTGNRIDLRFRD